MGDQMADNVDRNAEHQLAGDGSAVGDRRRRDLETHLQEQDTSSVTEGLSQTGSPSSLMRSRRRAFRPSERLQRYQRERLAQSGRTPALETDALASNSSPAWHEQSDRGDRQTAKRRKLDDGTYEEDPRTFSDNGQVVPGHLKMDIVNCDGGEYADGHRPISSYPQNLLSDDATVYCTKRNQCSLLFRRK